MSMSTNTTPASKRLSSVRATRRSTMETKGSPTSKISSAQELETLRVEHDRLTGRNKMLEKRVDDLMEDQTRQEGYIAEKEVAVDRLSIKLKGLEKDKRDAEKRLADQEKTFEMERESWKSTECDLESQLETVRGERDSAQAEQQSQAERVQNMANETGDSETIAVLKKTQESLQAESSRRKALESTLAHLARSLSTTQTSLQLTQSQFKEKERELKEEKDIGNRLREENEVWEGLVGTRTLEGTIGLGIGMGTIKRVKEHEKSSSSGVFEDPDYGTHRSTMGKTTRKSLADELGTFDLQAFAHEEEPKAAAVEEDEALEAEIEALRTEVKLLSDGNRGLKLYCSKILDRILEHPDSENLLAGVSSDPTTSRKIPLRPHANQRQSSFMSSSSSRPNTSRQNSDNVMRSPIEVPKAKVDPKTGLRPLSMLTGVNAAREAETENRGQLTKVETAAEKRATLLSLHNSIPHLTHIVQSRRGLSLNWSSFAGFTGPDGSPSPRTESGPSIDANREDPSPRLSGDRKLQAHDEDEEDRVERDRLAATMKLMGMQSSLPANYLSPTMSPLTAERSNSSQTQVSTQASSGVRPSRPTSRWGSLSFFGRSQSTTSAAPTTPVQSDAGAGGVQRLSPTLLDQVAREIPTEEHKRAIDSRLDEGDHSQSIVTPDGEKVGTDCTQVKEGEHQAKGSISTLFDVSVHN